MARLSWNEISARTAKFADEWADEAYEKGEAQSFWTEFLECFGVDRRRAGGFFEYGVKLAGKKYGFIDMFLPGRLLVEQKSAGRDLAKATIQALGYLDGIADHDLPDAIVASDFASFQVLDLNTREVKAFGIKDLPEHVRLFGALVGEEAAKLQEQSPVNREAAERMAALHVQLWDSGYRGHKLELFLVRLVFCAFADDAQIFEPQAFEKYIKQRTSVDGSDLGPRVGKLFEVLNTPPEVRAATLDEDLAAFPYINGGLFEELIPMPDFDAVMRIRLLEVEKPDWSRVSPAIFGAMFQGVMDDEARHDLGAHYTSEENILRAIQPLFLDDLYAEFESVRANKSKLKEFHNKLASLQILDPACGCGNFLVVSYQAIRRLEHRVIAAQQKDMITLTDVRDLLKVEVDQFHGIEIEEFPVLIARTAMWLTDHQMNLEASKRFGAHYTRIPLHEGANVVQGNALTMDWAEVIDPNNLNYIVGNPPFLGSRKMGVGQKKELRLVGKGYTEAGFLDYVAGWYILADRMMEVNPAIETAFVSTNSLSQGEQPGILWGPLQQRGNHINFAHRTFRWYNAARGIAHVHCIIIGFSRNPRKERQLYDYQDIAGEPILRLVDLISPYLIPGSEHVVRNRQGQISGQQEMAFGNMAADGGNLILNQTQRDELVTAYPIAEDWVRPFLGSLEFINRIPRYCLWLEGVSPGDIKSVPPVYDRVKATRTVRENSARPQLADTPQLFAQITQRPDKPFLLVPRVSSERREYVPMGFFEAGTVSSDACLAIEDADLVQFGILTSRMHMDWLRVAGGRLKSDLRYSKDIVYNNFVFPTMSDLEREEVTELAHAVLIARELHPDDSLAAMYDPVTMPKALRYAHATLDHRVDLLYRKTPFGSTDERAVFMLELHKARTANE